MAATSFDVFGITETPTFILCNPNKEQLYALGAISERKYSARFNSLSEISFRADEYVDGMKMEYYDYIVYRRLVYIPDLGYFMIREVSEENDGIVKYKEVLCQSLEVEFLDKKISLFKGTYKFYDVVNKQETFLFYLINSYMPGWEIDDSEISSSLLTKYRTFDITDTSLYNLLMSDAEEAYECVFFFDTINKLVWAKTIEDSTIDTGIYISHDNLVQTISIKESTDELVTALTVLGGGDVDIRQVNPLGTNNIYNFDYFATTEWMDQDLITAIDAWKTKLEEVTLDYDDLTVQLRETQLVLAEKDVEMAEFEATLAALEAERAAYIANGNNSALAAKTAEIDALNIEINALQDEIDELTSSETNPLSLAYIEAAMLALHEQVEFSVFFPNDGPNSLLFRLQPFIIQSSYINEYLTVNDLTSASAAVATSTELMEQAQGVLDRISQPRYTFDLEAVNFLAIPEFEFFQSQFELGAILYLEVEPDRYSRPFLLGYDINYDDPTDFKMIFGNRLRLNDEAFQFSDLLEDAISAGTESKVNSQIWNSWGETYKDPVSDFINSALDASLNNVVSGSGQNILIDAQGLRGRKSNDDGTWQPEQLWMVNNMLAFTDDGWESAKMAIGKFTFEDSNGGGQVEAWGIVADHLVGRMLISNELYITNENPETDPPTPMSFKVDATGATLINAYFEVKSTDAKTSIKIDPIYGISVNRNSIEKFRADMDGNVTIRGDLYSGDYSYIKSSGDWRLGGGSNYLLYTDSTGKLEFNGTLGGTLDWGSLNGHMPGTKWNSSAAGGTYSGAGIKNNSIGLAQLQRAIADAVAGIEDGISGTIYDSAGTGWIFVKGILQGKTFGGS